MSDKRKKDTIMTPSELISFFARSSFKRNATTIFDRAYEDKRVYNLTEGRNTPYNFPQILFFSSISSDFYGTFKEINELNNVEGACINDLSKINARNYADYKAKCIQIRKGSKAEYLFSYSPKYSMRDNLPESKREYAERLLKGKEYDIIRREIEKENGVFCNLSWVINYAMLFSSNDVLNLNPDYLEKRRHEIRNSEHKTETKMTKDDFLASVKSRIAGDSNASENDMDFASVTFDLAGNICDSFKTRANGNEDSDRQKSIAQELLQNMIARSCGVEELVRKKRISPYKHNQAQKFAEIDGNSIYRAVVSADTGYRKFQSMCEKQYLIGLDGNMEKTGIACDSGKSI